MIGRIEYTSCEDGLDGISGFQVRAMTSAIPTTLRTAALRDSVYEPPPAAPSMPSPAELAQFPVAFGYAYGAEGFVVYQSTYVGRDHTGRWGNYFAQALTADPAQPVSGLPIDLWGSPTWRTASLQVGTLEPVNPAELVSGGTARLEATAAFLAVSDRHRTLAGLLAMLRTVLESERGRLVLVVEDSTVAAQWVSAVTRSLPRALAWAVSFTTFTSRPESHSALLCFATPDVLVPSYGNFRTIDLRGAVDVHEVPPGDYEQVVTELWSRDDPLQLVEAAAITPPVSVPELDHFVRCALLFETLPVSVEWLESSVLDGLEFAVRRAPAMLLRPWDRVAGAVREIGGLRDVTRWSSVLSQASDRQAPIPGPLLNRYVQAAVAAIVAGEVDASTWVPVLDSTAQRDLARTLIAPQLVSEPSPQLSAWLGQPANEGVLGWTLDELAQGVEDPDDFERAVGAWSPTAAGSIAGLAGGRPRLHLAAETALAASGAVDPVDVLTRLSGSALRDPSEWPRLVSLLWPNTPPTIAQAEALLTYLPGDTLHRTGLADDHLMQRLLEDSGTGLTTEDYALADLLSRAVQRDRALLSGPNRRVLDLVVLIGYLGRRPSYADAIEPVVYGVAQRRGPVARSLANQFDAALARWLLPLDWADQQETLRRVMLPLDETGGSLLHAYGKVAEAEVAAAKPERVAELITTWRQLRTTSDGQDDEKKKDAQRVSTDLLEGVLARGLSRASRRQLERIGLSKLARSHAALPGESFERWWAEWQARHEPRGFLARFMNSKPDQGR